MKSKESLETRQAKLKARQLAIRKKLRQHTLEKARKQPPAKFKTAEKLRRVRNFRKPITQTLETIFASKHSPV